MCSKKKRKKIHTSDEHNVLNYCPISAVADVIVQIRTLFRVNVCSFDLLIVTAELES